MKPKLNSTKYIPFVIVFLVLTMAIGYAVINSVTFDIQGESQAKTQDGIFITEVKKLSSNGSETYKTNLAYQTNLNSTVTLDKNSDSKITYQITIYNSYDIDYYFYDTKYILCETNDSNCDTYSNENITFDITISNGDVIKSNDFLTFNITFKYLNGYSNGISNILNSIINFEFMDYPCPNDGTICDISGNNYHATIVGATWDRENKVASFDGIDDYMYLDLLDWNNTTEFTVDFVAKIHPATVTTPIILFETSKDSNINYASYYIDTNEFGNNELTLAMKYNNSGTYDCINHKYVNNIIDNDTYRHYTVTFNSLNQYDNFTKIYYDGIYHTTITHPPKEGQTTNNYSGDISGKTLNNYEFYVASRAGTKMFAQIDLKEVRIYNKELSASEVLNNHNGEIVKNKLLVHWDFR